MTEIMKFNFNNNAVACIIANGNPWFKAREVATIIGYVNTKQAIIKNVDDDKQTYAQLLETTQDKGLSHRPFVANEKNNIYKRIRSLLSDLR